MIFRERDELGDYSRASKKRSKTHPHMPSPSLGRDSYAPSSAQCPPWDRPGDTRQGPDIIREGELPFHVLPSDGRVYCNVKFLQLNKLDKVTHTWLTPDGSRYHRKTMLKVLGQRQTWSWNYIDVSTDRAKDLHGKWTVLVSVNGALAVQTSFILLRDWVQVQDGPLPIIISCPHAGRKTLPDCARRRPEQGSAEVASGILELVENLRSHLNVLFGVNPTLVTCKMHRKQLDVDAAESDAYDDRQCAPYYHRYYEGILSAIHRIVKMQRRSPLLLHIVGHNEAGQMMYVSTDGGQTLALMRGHVEGHVDVRFLEQSLISRMLACRWLVSPRREECPEEEECGVQSVVRAFSLLHRWRVDGLHVTVPSELCGGFGLRPFCHDLAESLAHMYHTYVHHHYIERLPGDQG